MKIKLQKQTDSGKYNEVHFIGYPDGKDCFQYHEDIEPHLEFLQNKGVISDDIKIIMQGKISDDKKLYERGPECK